MQAALEVLVQLVLTSMIVGFLCAIFVKKGALGALLAMGIPFSAVVCIVLYEEFVLPYRGGGASMWPIAIVFGGGAAAISGGVSYGLVRLLRQRVKRSS